MNAAAKNRTTCILLWLAIICGICSGDTIHLKSGGKLEGTLLNAEEVPRKSYRIRLDDGGDITLAVTDVRTVEKLSRQQIQYRKMLKELPDTVEAHMQLYEFCKKQSLNRQRNFHLEQIIRINPDHAEARALLKFKRRPDGSWAKLDDIRRDAGFVRWKGKWITQEEARRAEAAEKREEKQIEWKRNIRRWRGWLSDGRRRSKGAAAIRSIDDPLAVAALSEMFWDDKNIAVREMIAEVLADIGTSAAAKTLARAAMTGGKGDANDLRLLCVRLLKTNDMQAVAPAFVPSLRSASNGEVNRAAYALGELGDESVVLPLIKSIRTRHIKLVGGKGNGRINAGSGGVSMGQTKPKKVPYWENNKNVLDALAKLTKAPDFGYDQGRWLEWYRRLKTPPSLDLRRDS